MSGLEDVEPIVGIACRRMKRNDEVLSLGEVRGDPGIFRELGRRVEIPSEDRTEGKMKVGELISNERRREEGSDDLVVLGSQMSEKALERSRKDLSEPTLSPGLFNLFGFSLREPLLALLPLLLLSRFDPVDEVVVRRISRVCSGREVVHRSEGEVSKVGKLCRLELDLEVSSLVSLDALLAVAGLLDLCEIVRDGCSVSDGELSNPSSTLFPDLPFDVEETEFGIEEGDEVGGTMDVDGFPEEGKSEGSEGFGGEEEGGRSLGWDLDGLEEVGEDLGEDVERELRKGHLREEGMKEGREEMVVGESQLRTPSLPSSFQSSILGHNWPEKCSRL